MPLLQLFLKYGGDLNLIAYDRYDGRTPFSRILSQISGNKYWGGSMESLYLSIINLCLDYGGNPYEVKPLVLKEFIKNVGIDPVELYNNRQRILTLHTTRSMEEESRGGRVLPIQGHHPVISRIHRYLSFGRGRRKRSRRRSRSRRW